MTGEEQKKGKAIARISQTDQSPQFMKIARWVREKLPGDSELGDPLSVAGDEPPLVIARRLSELGAERPSATRELGLGALQVWQALSEAQGRGRGSTDVAILFTDLVEFSEWALQAGDDAALQLLRRVGTCEDGAVANHGGRVIKRLGDGMMAAFTEPEDALRAALETREEIAVIEVDGWRPVQRAGIHYGRPRKIGGDLVGVDVNIAARVAGAASAGEVLVSAAVCERLDEQDWRLKRRKRFKAKGAPKELEVFAAEPA